MKSVTPKWKHTKVYAKTKMSVALPLTRLQRLFRTPFILERGLLSTPIFIFSLPHSTFYKELTYRMFGTDAIYSIKIATLMGHVPGPLKVDIPHSNVLQTSVL